MYQVSIFNNGEETIIHVPVPDKDAPHIIGGKYKGRLSQPDILSIILPINNPGFEKIEGLVTKVRVTDSRDDSTLFIGRVMPFKNEMSDSGLFRGELTCEGALGYFNDSKTRRWNFTNKTPAEILTAFLNHHNSTIVDDRQIQLGIVEINQPITIDTNYETILNAIITKIRNVLGGDIRVRETAGVLYLDYLTAQGVNNGVEVRLGANMKSITRVYDPTDVITRAICQGYGEGINQLNITSVNNGVEYVEDADAKAKYGVIEDTYINKEIQNAYTLMQAGKTFLKEKKQPKLTLDTKMVDRSVLKEYELEKHNLGDTLRVINPVFNIDVYTRVVETDIDILLPHNRDNVISTRPISLIDKIIDLKQRSQTLENAPQGSTCIYALPKAENADIDHPIEFDLDIPKETININRVYINLHGRKYRANSKDAAAGGAVTITSANGGASSQNITSPPASAYDPGNIVVVTTGDADAKTPHYHTLPTGLLAMAYNHTHSITVNVAAHQHEINIASHIHAAVYGIVESTYPRDCYIKVNGTTVRTVMGNGVDPFDYYDIDITPYVSIGNNKIEIGTYQNGRIDAVVYSQVFIQSK